MSNKYYWELVIPQAKAQDIANTIAAGLQVGEHFNGISDIRFRSRIAELESALAAEVKRSDTLAQALEPFAACAVVWDDNEKESGRVIHVSRQGVKGKPDLVLTVGDLLDAYTALIDWRTVRGAK